jgi:hypothetical protein
MGRGIKRSTVAADVDGGARAPSVEHRRGVEPESGPGGRRTAVLGQRKPPLEVRVAREKGDIQVECGRGDQEVGDGQGFPGSPSLAAQA